MQTPANYTLVREIPGGVRLYSHPPQPGLFELLPLTGAFQVHPELQDLGCFLDYADIRKSGGAATVVFAYEGSGLDTIWAQNESVEETYISLIVRSMIDAVLQLQGVYLTGLDLRLGNWRVTPEGALKAKNRFELRKGADPERDFQRVVGLLKQLVRVENLDDPCLCVSQVFREFLRLALELVPRKESENKLKVLREARFLRTKTSAGVLTDLIEEAGSNSQKSAFPSKKGEEVLEKSGSNATIGEDFSEFTQVAEAVFRKYIEQETREGDVKVASILDNICKGLVELEMRAPGRARKVMERYTKLV